MLLHFGIYRVAGQELTLWHRSKPKNHRFSGLQRLKKGTAESGHLLFPPLPRERLAIHPSDCSPRTLRADRASLCRMTADHLCGPISETVFEVFQCLLANTVQGMKRSHHLGSIQQVAFECRAIYQGAH